MATGLALAVYALSETASSGGVGNFTTIGGTASPSNIFQAFSTIDDVRISSGVLSVQEFLNPEPGSATMIALAAGLLAARRRRA